MLIIGATKLVVGTVVSVGTGTIAKAAIGKALDGTSLTKIGKISTSVSGIFIGGLAGYKVSTYSEEVIDDAVNMVQGAKEGIKLYREVRKEKKEAKKAAKGVIEAV